MALFCGLDTRAAFSFGSHGANSALGCASFAGAKNLLQPRAQPIASDATEYEIAPLKGTPKEVKEWVEFFTDSFWEASTTWEGVSFTDKERKEVSEGGIQDMEQRYGQIMGKRRLQSQFFVAREPDTGKIVGCVGVEAAIVDPMLGKVFTRTEGESLIKTEFEVMSVRERPKYRRLHIKELTEAFFPEYKVFGLLANLAVDKSTRGKGLARILCKKCEEKTAEWGLDAIVLQVEEANVAGRGLYQAVGYQDISTDEEATVIRVAPGAGQGKTLYYDKAPMVLMGKGIGE